MQTSCVRALCARPCKPLSNLLHFAHQAARRNWLLGATFREGSMSAPSQKEITQMLRAWSGGDHSALDELMPLVYRELRRMAATYLRRERPNHTLQATALVHEAYLHLIDQSRVTWQNRAHFFGVAAQLMRRILVDYARSHQAAKRGGTLPKVPLEQAVLISKAQPADLVALDETLTRLGLIDPQQARVVELRVFGGLTVEEIAGLLGVSPATVKRDWSMAKAWLMREIAKGKNVEP